MEKYGFHILGMKTIAYRKTYAALMEDKGQYFGITYEVLHMYLRGASEEATEQYALTHEGMTLFYTMVVTKR